MNKDVIKDRYATHAVTNYLFAGYQGRFTFLNILSQLNFANLNLELLTENRQALDKIAKWTDDLWKGQDLFSASWATAQTFESNSALELLDKLKPDLYANASELIRILTDTSDFSNRFDDLKFLVASFGRYAYSRDNYIQGFIQFGQKFNIPEEVEQYSGAVQAAQEDIKMTHLLIKVLQNPEKIDAGFGAALSERCLALPATFRTHAHDINQIVANYRGGFTFELGDFTREEAQLWSDQGFGAGTAGYWRANNFSPTDAKEWIDVRITSPAAAFDWRLFQFKPEIATAWATLGFTPSLAFTWFRAGYDPEQSKAFIEKGIYDPAKLPGGSSNPEGGGSQP